MHFAGRFEKSALSAHPVYESHSQGYTHASLVNHATGSVHTGLSMNQLAAQGTLSRMFIPTKKVSIFSKGKR